MQPLLDSGVARAVFARVGRGAVALFEVDSNATLQYLINEWSEIVPAHFDVYPLLDPASAQRFLAKRGGREGFGSSRLSCLQPASSSPARQRHRASPPSRSA
jgi:hypothetical protein